MKTKKIILAIGFAFTFIAFNINAFGQNNKATLKETTDWMTSKVEGQYFSSLNKFFNVSLTWDTEKKVMKYTCSNTETAFKKPIDGYYVIEFDPKNINPRSIYMSDKGSYIKIHFSCNNGTGCLKSYTLKYDENDNLVKETLVSWKSYDITLYEDVLKKNEDLPNRFIEAFKYLIQLRGGAGEKF